jgi:predicted PurR-regulated permease PerM
MSIQKEQLFRYFFLGVFLFVLFQILNLLSPFYTGILGAIVLALIAFPMHRFIHEKVGYRHKNLAAGLSTALVIVLIIIPFFFFSWLLLNEVSSLTPVVKKVGETLETWRQKDHWTDIEWVRALQEKFKGVLDLSGVNFQKILTDGGKALVNGIVAIGKKIPKNAFAFIINVMGMVLTLFFLFRDGPYIFKRAKELVPMERKHKDQIANQLYLTVTAVVRGVFLVSVSQGAVAGIGYLIAGVPSALLLAFATTFTATIPFVGAAAIWLPVGIYFLVQGFIGKGIFLLLWGALVVSIVDNFLRPIIIGNRAKMPMLFLFFGLLGGIKMYGPMGIFLGPLTVALLMAFIRIYQEDYQK